MLPHSDQGQGEPTFVLMHYLGGSHRTWFPTLPTWTAAIAAWR